MNFQEQDRKYLFRFINERKAALYALGIIIVIPEQGTMAVRYARVITQIEKLNPEKQTIFNTLRFKFIKQQRKMEAEQKEKLKMEEEKQKERLEMLEQMSQEKRKQLEAVNENMPVDDMPDCEIRYQKIVKEANEQGKQFEDKKFGHDDKALGLDPKTRYISGWKRASEDPECYLWKDKISCDGVT